MVKAVKLTQSLKNQVQWRSSYLFACCVIHNNQPEEEDLDFIKRCSGSSNDLSVYYYNVLGNIYSSRRRPNHLNQKKIETQRSITSFFEEFITIQDFLVIFIVAKLRENFLNELFLCANRTDENYDFSDYNIKLNELVSDLLPSLKGERIDKFGEYKAVRHVLYFEPNTQLLSMDDRGVFEKTSPLVKRLRDQLGNSLGGEVAPTLLDDIIFFPGMGYGNREKSFVAVRLSPLDSKGYKHTSLELFQIPLIPMSFLSHVAICTIMDFYSHTVASLSLNTEKYWDLGKSWGNFVNYRTQHMETRLEVERLLLRVDELEENINNLLETIHIYEDHNIDFLDLIKNENSSSSFFEKSFSSIIKEERRKKNNKLNRNIERVKTRMVTLDSFLHDSAMADSTSINLRLAKSVEKLTWVVVLIAFLTLLSTLIADDIKTNIFSGLIKKIRSLL